MAVRDKRTKKLTIEIKFIDDSEAIVLLNDFILSIPGLIQEKAFEFGSAEFKSKCVYDIAWQPGEVRGENIVYKSDFS
jgi:hypothetical protein